MREDELNDIVAGGALQIQTGEAVQTCRRDDRVNRIAIAIIEIDDDLFQEQLATIRVLPVIAVAVFPNLPADDAVGIDARVGTGRADVEDWSLIIDDMEPGGG